MSQVPDPSESKGREQSEKRPVRVWSARVIGWTTLVAGFGGLLVACVNWFRMGLRRKAVKHHLLGGALGSGVAAATYLFNEKYPTPPQWLFITRVVVWLVLIFLAVAYLHKSTERDIARVANHRTLREGSILTAIGLAVLGAVGWALVSAAEQQMIAYLRMPRLESSATVIADRGLRSRARSIPGQTSQSSTTESLHRSSWR